MPGAWDSKVWSFCSLKCLLLEQCNEAVQMLLRRTSQAAIARNFQVSRSMITRLYQRLRQTGTTNDRPRSGRLCYMSRRQDQYIHLTKKWMSAHHVMSTGRYMHLTHLRNRFRTAVEMALLMP